MSLGNQNNPLAARTQGVRTARNATAPSSGSPQTVNQVVEGKCVFVGYNDERGEARTALFFKVGDQYYAPKDSVQWCSQLLPMTDWLRDAVQDKVRDEAPVVASKGDAVDVMGGGDDESEAGSAEVTP